jgi:hypothetical protein
MWRNLFFSDLNKIITESYLELQIAGYLALYQRADNLLGERFSQFFGYMVIILSFLPLLINVVYKRKEPDFLYPFFFFGRRFLFLVIIFLNNENYQIYLVLLLNCFYMMYLGHKKPFKGRHQNRLEMMNEFLVHLICFHMLYFAGLEPDESD